jgi:hypothetical protein
MATSFSLEEERQTFEPRTGHLEVRRVWPEMVQQAISCTACRLLGFQVQVRADLA